MFGFIKKKIQNVYNQFTNKATILFSSHKIDDEFLNKLTELLITADTGYKTTTNIIKSLRLKIKNKKLSSSEDVKTELKTELTNHLQQYSISENLPKILLLVGVNGSGKTTFAAKFAHKLNNMGKKVLLVAGDTFRAAAIAQLQKWGDLASIEVFTGKENQDPASVIFDACKKFQEEHYDNIVIDTAGRLQTKTNLMHELTKIRKIINKKLSNKSIHTWLTIDSMLGQNSFEQAKTFKQATNLNGIILTKLDGTGKGGIVFAITSELQLPITYVTFGEKLEDIKSFEPKEYVQNLLEK